MTNPLRALPRILIVFAALAFAPYALADQTIQFIWDAAATGPDPHGYRLLVDGVESSRIEGDDRVAQASFAPGDYSITVEAYRVDDNGKELWSDPSEPYLLSIPAAPVDVRVDIVVETAVAIQPE